jgi:hypothetical protein
MSYATRVAVFFAFEIAAAAMILVHFRVLLPITRFAAEKYGTGVFGYGVLENAFALAAVLFAVAGVAYLLFFSPERERRAIGP